MTMLSRAALVMVGTATVISAASAQTSFGNTKGGATLKAGSGGAIVSAIPAKTITAQQLATLPKKVVNGQQMALSNGQWGRIVASGGGNYQIVASGGGN